MLIHANLQNDTYRRCMIQQVRISKLKTKIENLVYNMEIMETDKTTSCHAIEILQNLRNKLYELTQTKG